MASLPMVQGPRTAAMKLKDAGPIRYLKITVTGLDDGCWASICEVKEFGSERPKGVSK